MSDPADRFIELNGCRLHYLDWGDPAAPPVLLVHGLTQHAHAFDGLARHLSPRLRCIALDVRGRGQSAWAPAETYHIVQYAKDVVALLDALDIPAAHYVGTSMGGLTAMALGLRAPERLRRVVINDIGPVLEAAGLERIASSVAGRSGGFASLDEFIEKGMLPFYYWLRGRPMEQLREMARWAVRQGEDGRWIGVFDPATVTTIARDPESLDKLAEFLWPGFKALAGPVLVVRGAESDLLSRETVAAMQAAKPGTQVVEVPGASHAPVLDEPEALAAVGAFLA